MVTNDDIGVEEDEMRKAWCVAPSEACTFVVLAVFAYKADAERFVTLLRERHRDESSSYDDFVVLPARAVVLAADTYDDDAGHAALALDDERDASAAGPARKGWDCPRCSFFNDDGREICRSCLSPELG